MDEGPQDHNEDRHSLQEDAVRALISNERFPLRQIDRLELGFLANGEVTCRWRELGQEEYDGIVLTREDIETF